YYTAYYIDHNAVGTGGDISSLQDYACGTRTYDTDDGYNHQGTDIVIAPYAWNMMETEQADIIAAAAGLIIYKEDGNYDQNCGFNELTANAIGIEHDDGTIAYYFHMKNGSLTSKAEGETVETGEFLGKVGSSGSSFLPHLHFEVQDGDGNVIDPWEGACNPTITSSMWNNQKPYYDPAVVSLKTHYATPVTYSCPTAADMYESNHFVPAQYIEFRAYIRDLMPDYSVTFNIYNPSGTLKWTDTQSFDNYYSLGYCYLPELLSATATSGTWKFNLVYNGITYSHYFTVNCTPVYTLSGSHTGHKGFLAGDYITSTATIPGSSINQVVYEAENYIRFDVGFNAVQNCELLARIDGCDTYELKTISSPLEQMPSKNNIDVFPNPFQSAANIQLELVDEATVTISIIDLTGKEILRPVDHQSFDSGMHDIKMNMEIFSPGVYLMRSELNDDITINKIIKIY
ncbi:MAG: peptidoglycan DD-metalloendopeptidase family protein, partial [Chitinophagales bacterium]